MGPQRPQSPFQALAPVVPDITVNLVVRDTPRDTTRVEKPFTIPLTLVLSAPLTPGRDHQHRVVRLVIQHLQPPRVSVPALATSAPPVEAFSPRLPSSGFSTPSSTAPNFNYALAHQKLAAVASPGQHAFELLERNSKWPDSDTPALPPPYFSGTDEPKSRSTSVLFVGASAQYLPSITLSTAEHHGAAADHTVAVHDFTLTYIPTQKGFATVGGLRVLLVDDRFVDEGKTHNETYRSTAPARVLKEWDVISEVWVSP